MKLTNIWILEDCKSHQQIYSEIFEGKYQLTIFPDLKQLNQAMNESDRPTPAMLISDLMLPDGNFLNFIKREKRLLTDIPCFVVSSLIDEKTIESLFNLGAIDYLTKPFQPTELIAKINRYLKSNVDHDGLTKKESKIYRLLCQRDQISKDQLQRTIWGSKNVQDGLLNVHIHNLRKKLKAKNLGVEFLKPDTYRLIRF